MKNEINFIKKEKGIFSPDYFIKQLGEISTELREKISNSILGFISKYTSDINYTIIDEEDMRTTFENIQYFMSFYAYKNDLDVKDEVINVAKFLNESFEYYKATIYDLKSRIEKLIKFNPLLLPEVTVYFERLKLTLKAYENLISCNLNMQTIEFMPMSYRGNDYPFFSLVPDTEAGFYSFCNIVSDIENQFEFFKLFNPEDIIRVYNELNFDVTPLGTEHKYNNILTPVLQQYLFCCEYSVSPVSLKLHEDDVKNIGVDLKIFFTKKEKTNSYYILSENEFKNAAKMINTSDASEYYKSKLYELIRDFRYNETICDKGFVACSKDVLERIICNIRELKAFDKYCKITEELIKVLTGKLNSIIYYEDYIDDEYLNILIDSLKNDSDFITLSDSAKEYILENVPDVRNSLLAFKKMKNLAFVVN